MGQSLGQIVLLVLGGMFVVGAVLFGWVMIMTRPSAPGADWPSRQPHPEAYAPDQESEHDRIVRAACADLDAEYRELLDR